MAIHNIERCRDGCRTSLLIAGVVLVPAIFHTSLPPCHPYITTPFMEMIFSTCSTNFLIHVGHIEKRLSLLYHTYKYQPVPGTSLHLTELSDDVSLCAYLVEYYLSAFYKTIIIAMIKKQ